MTKLRFHLSFVFLGSLLLMGCAGTTNVVKSDFQKLKVANEGAFLTVNLQTNGRVRDDKNCYLKFEDGESYFQLLINRGTGDYALPLVSGETVFEITKISCGPFYYYDLKDQGATFKVDKDKVKYLGHINFKFEEKGKLEWGHATKNDFELRKRALSMGLGDSSLKIDLLNL
jgi:hypothetical protein